MNDEYPAQGIEGQSQDRDAERGGVPASLTGDTPTPPGGGLPPTGDDRVDAALASLGRLPGTPADDHVAVLEEVHGQLRDILGELGEGTP
jgi:hypothetical protein